MDIVDVVTSKGVQYEVADSHARRTMLPRSELPKAVSYFENDAGYVDKNVEQLENFYGKSETYTRDEVDSRLNAVLGENASGLEDERAARERADSRLQESIDEEASERKSAEEELRNRIDEVSVGNENLQKMINSEAKLRQEADDALGKRIDAIDAKIPAQASSGNKLADKDFVNSSIATNTAHFIGTFSSLEELEGQREYRVTPNDYAFVVRKDADGNTLYDRYKYTGAGIEPGTEEPGEPDGDGEDGDGGGEWLFEYSLNNSGFTQEQWKAVNSGATAEIINRIKDGNGTEAGLLRLSDAVDGTQGTADATAATPGSVKRAYDKAVSAGGDAADALERIAAEVSARTDADTELGKRIDAEASERGKADSAMDALIQQLRTTKQDKIPVVDTKDELKLEDGEIGIAKEDGLFYQDGDELLIVATKENEPVITTDNSPKRLYCTVSKEGTDIIYTVDIWPAFQTIKEYEKILVSFYTPCTNGNLGILIPIIKTMGNRILNMSALSTGNIAYDGSELSDGVAKIRFRGKGVGDPGQVQNINYIRI